MVSLLSSLMSSLSCRSIQKLEVKIVKDVFCIVSLLSSLTSVFPMLSESTCPFLLPLASVLSEWLHSNRTAQRLTSLEDTPSYSLVPKTARLEYESGFPASWWKNDVSRRRGDRGDRDRDQPGSRGARGRARG